MKRSGTYSKGVGQFSHLYQTATCWLTGALLLLWPAIAPGQPSLTATQVGTNSMELRLTAGQVPSLYSVHFAPTLEALESNPAVLASGLAQSPSQTVAVPISPDASMMFFRLAELPLTPEQLASLTDPDNEQTVTVNGVSVTVPAGTLDVPATVAVVGRPPAEAGIPTAPYGLEAFQVFEVQIGNETQFNQDLILALPYDPARLNPDLPVEDALVVSYWIPESKSWKSVPITVDPEAGVVRFSTPHLSTWAVRYIAQGWRVLKSNNLHARVVFDPTQPVSRGKTRIPAQDYAQLIADAGEAAYSAYKTAGFIVPEEQWYIIVDASAVPEASWSGWTGDVYLPSVFDDDEWVGYTVGHELFHSVQNAYYNIFSASGRQWWHEACATYASWHYIFNRGYPFRTPDVNAWGYPGLPVCTVNDAHEYVTAELLAFIFARSGLTFKAHFDDMESYGASSTLKRLEQTVKSKTGHDLHRFYRLFCGDYWLNRAGVLTNFNPLLNPDGSPAAIPLFGKTQKRADFAFSLRGGYTAGFDYWKVESSGESRNLTVEIEGVEGKASVDVYVVTNFVGQGNVWPKGTLLKAKARLDVTVPANHYLVLVGVNYDASANSAIRGFITPNEEASVSGPIEWTYTVPASGYTNLPSYVPMTVNYLGTWRIQGAIAPEVIITTNVILSFNTTYRGDVDDHVAINLNFTPTVTPAQHTYTQDGITHTTYQEMRYERIESMVEASFALEDSSSDFGQLSGRFVQKSPREPNGWVGGFTQYHAVYKKHVATWDGGRSETEWSRSFEFIVSVAVNCW